MDLHEDSAIALGHGAVLIADLLVGGDSGGNDAHAVAGEEAGDEADTADVSVAILLAEAKALRKVGADDVAVENLDPAAALAERGRERLGERALAGTRESVTR